MNTPLSGSAERLPPVIQYPLGVGSSVTRVLEAGSGDRAVVFLHGLGARADRWRESVARFAAAGWHAYAFDFPGHGLATKTDRDALSMPGFAQVLASLMDALDLETAALVGTSLGGHVAAYFTCSAPQRVDALVLVGAVGLTPLGQAAGNAIRDNVSATDRASIEQKLRFVLAHHELITPALLEEEFRINNSPGAARALRRLGDYIAERLDEDTVGQRLAQLRHRVPMQLLWGALDQAVPLSLGQAASELLSLELCVIATAGHAPYLECPEPFDREVMPFLNACQAAQC